MLLKDVEGEFDEVVVVQAEALLLLVEVAVEDDVPCLDGIEVLFLQGVQGQVNQVPVILRFAEQLVVLNHVPSRGEGHIPQG